MRADKGRARTTPDTTGRAREPERYEAIGVLDMTEEEWKERLDTQALLTAHTNKETEGVRHGRFIIPPARASNNMSDY